ncbi:hypothetical protein [Roseomonas marmotae]|uniref:Large polyvalent protein associated domain-containing protein n=1 Tax=Roseomonas marmotae TaxID=2768161 RepID=A0ABS3K7D8_9PROT|nr:hypothetical protein [Roseomonas marmotae]MBO1073372.1 hypothetical protein [Roseomonas marmotae]
MSETAFSPQAREIAPFWFDTGTPVASGRQEVIAASVASTWNENVGPMAYRWGRRLLAGNAASQLDPGEEAGWSGPLLSVDEANQRYGIPGHISFSRSISEFAARELHDLKRAEIVRNDTLARAQGGAIEWGGRIVGSLAAGMADPLNIASAFVPVVGPTRAAAWMAQAGSRLGRVGVAARIGAIEGAAGAAMLEPAAMALSADEQRDHDMLDSLMNVAFGGLLGSGLHAGGRAIADAVRGWRPGMAGTPVFGTPAAEMHEAQMRAAVAAVAGGEPIQAAGLSRIFRDGFRDELLGGAARIAPDPDGVWRVQPDAGRRLTPERVAALPVPEDPGQAALAREVELRGAVRAPVLDTDGEPVMALSRAEERELSAGLEREGHGLVDWVRMDDQPGAYAMSRVEGAEVYRTGDGAPRVYASATQAKAAARQLRTSGWFPVEVPDEGGFVLLREPRAEGGRAVANRRMLEIGPDFLRPGNGEVPMSSSERQALFQQVARQTIRDMDAAGIARANAAWASTSQRAAAPLTTPGEPPGIPEALANEMASWDAVLAENLKAGRITEADLADIRAADEGLRVAQERAKAYDAAAACLIANGA